MRFRPRFSVRTLAILVAIVCAYFEAWEATKRHAASRTGSVLMETDSETTYIVEAAAIFPLIVRQKESIVLWNELENLRVRRKSKGPVYYYLWIFGPKFKLPVQGEWELFPPRRR